MQTLHFYLIYLSACVIMVTSLQIGVLCIT